MYRSTKHSVKLGIAIWVAIIGVAEAELRDPTMPYGYTTTPVDAVDGEQLQLMGIIKGSNGRSAVLNGKRVRAGDLFQGKRIVAVNSNHIVLAVGEQQQKLFLFSQTMKKVTPKKSGGKDDQ